MIKVGETRDVDINLVGKPLRNRPLRKPRRAREENIKTDLRETNVRIRGGCNWLRIVSNCGLWQ
jgi:hypothetical protein